LALVTPALAAVTETSYKYVDLEGNIHFAVSQEAVPAQFADPRWMSGSIEQETDNHSQQISFLDVDGDAVPEILVTITTIFPTLREETTVEIIKPISTYYLNLATVKATRGLEVQFYDFNADGRLEIFGPVWGGGGELWVWENGRYQNILTALYEPVFLELQTQMREQEVLTTIYQQWYAAYHRHRL
jgi:hypothetical protein